MFGLEVCFDEGVPGALGLVILELDDQPGYIMYLVGNRIGNLFTCAVKITFTLSRESILLKHLGK